MDARIGRLLGDPIGPTLLRYAARNACFQLLGRSPTRADLSPTAAEIDASQ